MRPTGTREITASCRRRRQHVRTRSMARQERDTDSTRRTTSNWKRAFRPVSRGRGPCQERAKDNSRNRRLLYWPRFVYGVFLPRGSPAPWSSGRILLGMLPSKWDCDGHLGPSRGFHIRRRALCAPREPRQGDRQTLCALRQGAREQAMPKSVGSMSYSVGMSSKAASNVSPLRKPASHNLASLWQCALLKRVPSWPRQVGRQKSPSPPPEDVRQRCWTHLETEVEYVRTS